MTKHILHCYISFNETYHLYISLMINPSRTSGSSDHSTETDDPRSTPGLVHELSQCLEEANDALEDRILDVQSGFGGM